MKIRKNLLITFALLPLAVSLIALMFLPDQIPAHYGADFTVDRYGSKFEILILPIITPVMGSIFLLPGIWMKNESYKRLIWNFGLALMLFFNVLCYVILYMQANRVTNMRAAVFGLERILLLGFGALFVFIGNMMPLARRNAIVGLRTKWSMTNDTVWKKCQLFGGVSLMILGILFMIIAFVYPSIPLMIALLLTVAVIDTIYTYFAAKKYADKTA